MQAFLSLALLTSVVLSATQSNQCTLPFYQDAQNVWHACPAGCLRCVSQSQCTQCEEGYFFESGECLECDESCATCETQETHCLTCEALSFTPIFYENTCLHQCPSHFFYDLNSCMECAASCVECAGSATSCTQCQPTEVLTPENTCITCPENHFNQNGACTTCDSSCAACEVSPTQCTSCPHGMLFVQLTHSCLAACPSGHFQSSAQVCSACDANCLECANSATECTKCDYDQQISAASQCEEPTSCSHGSYFNVKTKQCELCDANCVQCVNTPTQCMECQVDSGFKLDHLTRSCVEDCPSGTFSDDEECLVCGAKCAECEDDPDLCSSCLPGLKMHEEECVTACPSHTYLNEENECHPCADECAECIGPLNTDCSRCPPHHIINLGTCQACQTNEFASENNTCEPCESPCATCAAADFCLTCEDLDSILYNGECIPSCPEGTYLEESTCLPCESPCATCTASDVCLTCQQSSQSPKQYQGQCMEECPEQTWDDHHICRPCDASCASCRGSATYCLSCPESLPMLDTTTNQCVAQCQQGQFESNGRCYECCAPCSACSFPTHCTACDPASQFPYLVASQATCVAHCPVSTWLDGDKCSACDAECSECANSANTCSACKTGFYLSGTSCLECSPQCTACEGAPDNCTLTCPNGTFESAGGGCQQCNSPCKHCTSQTECTSCIAGYFFQAPSSCTQCTQQSTAPECQACEDGLYFNGEECVQCADACASCLGPSESDCLQCHENYFLAASGVCQQCELPCNSCQVSASACSSCVQGFYLDQASCVPCNQACATCEDATALNCPGCNDGFYQPLDTTVCAACDDACKTCTGSGANTCESCADGYFQNEEQVCQACDASCGECEGPSALECTACHPGWHLVNDESCSPCSTNCLDCDGPSPSQCIECMPQFFFADAGCQRCNAICLDCTGPQANQCSECANDFVLFQNYCVSQCPLSTVQVHHECLICHQPKCAECLPHNLSHCTACHQSSSYALLKDGSCLQSCPALHYPYQQSCLSCPSTLPSDSQELASALRSCRLTPSLSEQARILQMLERKKNSLLKSTPSTLEVSDLIELAAKSLISMPPEYNTTLSGIILIKRSLSTSYDFILDPGSLSGVRVEAHLPLHSHNTKQLVAALFHDPLYPESLSAIPTVDLNIYESSSSPTFTPISNETITLIFTFSSASPKPHAPVACSFWDSSLNLWSTEGVATQTLGSETIVCTTSHLSSYSVVLSEQGVLVGEDLEHKAEIILQFFCAFFLGLVLLILGACVCDICTFRSKRDHYPHRSRSLSTACCRVFRYSLLYNLHIINVCGYRSQLILCTFKAFWVSDLFLTVFYSLELLVAAKFWILALSVALLGCLLVPCSFLECCLLRRKPRTLIQFSDQDVQNKEIASDRSSKDFMPTQFARINSSVSARSSQEQRYTHHKLNIVLFCLFTFATYGAAISVTLLRKEEVAQQFELFFLSLSSTFSLGLVLSFIKIGLAACSAALHPSSHCLDATFVDPLTRRIVQDVEQVHASRREVIEFESEKPQVAADVYDEKVQDFKEYPPTFPEQSFGPQAEKESAF